MESLATRLATRTKSDVSVDPNRIHRHVVTYRTSSRLKSSSNSKVPLRVPLCSNVADLSDFVGRTLVDHNRRVSEKSEKALAELSKAVSRHPFAMFNADLLLAGGAPDQHPTIRLCCTRKHNNSLFQQFLLNPPPQVFQASVIPREQSRVQM